MQFPSMVDQVAPSAMARPPAYVGQAPPYASPPPAASLQGTIQPSPPPSEWDPYAAPADQPPVLSPSNSYGQVQPDGTPQQVTRLFQQVRIRNAWLYGGGAKDLGVNDVELSTSLAFPLFGSTTPFLVTPGFSFHLWNGPDSGDFVGSPDLPGVVYDAFVETSWSPQFNSWLAADLAVEVGVFSDFDRVSTAAIRIPSRGLGIITLSPQWKLAAGVLYVDRVRIKILPAGGVIWTPHADSRFDIVFPNPRISQRLTTIRNTDLWGYVAGEFGGGSWELERANGIQDEVDYNDIRVLLGLEWAGFHGLKTNFEVGYVFDREIVYRSGTPTAKPDDTFVLRGGLSF